MIVARAFAPATVANLGPGYDVLGLAVGGPGDVVEAWLTDSPGVHIAAASDGVPIEPERNTAGVAALETVRRAGTDVGVTLTIEKGMPVGSGLGSSAASAAAAAFAVNAVLGSPLRRVELIDACVEAEAVVSGRHADNVAAAILGGLVLVRGVDPVEVVRIPVPAGLHVAIVTPSFELPTRTARAALPETVTLAERTRVAADIATFVAACYSDDLPLLGTCVRDDVVAEVRAGLVPGAPEALRAARAAGALASSVSGAGPTLFALCHSGRVAGRASAAMVDAFSVAGVTATAFVSPGECPGARLIDG